MNKVVIEIPLREKVRPDDRAPLVARYRLAIEGALRACKVGDRIVHDPAGIRARVENDPETKGARGRP
ncbi:hypothetical protein LVJ94_35405 [Pendulispora rubella]|uniref:Uncharacterized protein n=1 Tax=Pendulispora rubella TaxID=2741070 RepID=A0ABZ2KXA8_9BACT